MVYGGPDSLIGKEERFAGSFTGPSLMTPTGSFFTHGRLKSSTTSDPSSSPGGLHPPNSTRTTRKNRMLHRGPAGSFERFAKLSAPPPVRPDRRLPLVTQYPANRHAPSAPEPSHTQSFDFQT
jgi:hypothetical protein